MKRFFIELSPIETHRDKVFELAAKGVGWFVFVGPLSLLGLGDKGGQCLPVCKFLSFEVEVGRLDKKKKKKEKEKRPPPPTLSCVTQKSQFLMEEQCFFSSNLITSLLEHGFIGSLPWREL